ENQCIDTDYFAVHVDKRSSRVSRVYGSISLNKIRVLAALDSKITSGSRNYPGGHRLLKSKRATQCNYPFALFQLVGIAEPVIRPVLSINLDYGKIGFAILADDSRL